MPLPLPSFFANNSAFLVAAYPGCPGKEGHSTGLVVLVCCTTLVLLVLCVLHVCVYMFTHRVTVDHAGLSVL